MNQDEPAIHAATVWQTRVLGLGLILLAVCLAYALVLLWPQELPAKNGVVDICSFWSGKCTAMSMDRLLILLVIVAGGLGSFVHTATSFGDFVGNQKLGSNWIWWYLLKPFIGMALAVIFFLVVRGSFLSVGNGLENVNVYGITALAGMAGMFSKQATDKLSEVFNSLFKTEPGGGDARRKDELGNPVPVLSLVEPETFVAGSQAGTLLLKGSGFIRGSAVRINGQNRDATFKDSSQLSVELLPSDMKDQGEIEIAVSNPPPGGGTSVSMKVKIVGAEGDQILDAENALDGCDVEVLAFTADDELPPAKGGVE